jgi:Ca-activated chloride channel family protein
VSLVALCFLVLVPLSTAAQVPSFPSRSDLVVLSATAVDRHGRPVRDLRPEEISVLEDGRPQKIVHFAHARALRARVLLLVDASGSMGVQPETTSAWMAAVQLLDALDPEDEVSLAGFDLRYRTVVPFTRDRSSLLAGLTSLRPFGSTALHDALGEAARQLVAQGEGRRAVILVSDGIDTASRENPEAVLAQSRALDAPIYALTILSPLDDPESPLFVGEEQPMAALAGHSLLRRYALLSGGGAFRVSDFGALKEAALQIASELRHQYQLGYHPPGGTPRFRRIEVRSRRKGVALRTRRGYLPRP